MAVGWGEGEKQVVCWVGLGGVAKGGLVEGGKGGAG